MKGMAFYVGEEKWMDYIKCLCMILKCILSQVLE